MSSANDFVIDNGVLTKYTGLGGDVIIPEGVTEIEKGVFSNRKSLLSVTLPKSLEIVGVEAFANCKGLTSVAIPPSVKEIRFGAFDWCDNLKDVFISDLATWCRIEFGGVNANCGNPLSAGARLYVNGEVLTELVIPDTIETVNNYAFYHCVSLESISIPKGAIAVGNYAFFDCANLKSVSFPESLVSIGDGSFCDCKKLAEANIPKSVKTIGDVAFMNCRKLTEVILPEGVELLGVQAFGNCGKLKVSLPRSLKRPKADMFGYLWEIAPFAGSACSIQIEKWSTLITKVVEGSAVEEITTSNYALIPGEILLHVANKMMKKKGWNPASGSGKALLEGLTKSSGRLCDVALTNIEWLQLLCDNKLIKAMDLDAYLEAAEKQNNTEAKATLLNYQNELGSKAVEKAREKKEKDKEAYADVAVERAAKRDPAKGVEGMTFVITGQLNVWPKVWASRKEVEEYLARYGAKLGASVTKETDYLVTNDTESGSAKNEKAKKLGVEVIDEKVFNQMIGRRFIDKEVIHVPSWVKTIESGAFSFPDWESWKYDGYKKLQEVILPEGISRIGEKAFAGAENLESIRIPDSVKSIEDWAFARCKKLAEVILPKNLQSIGACTFDGCRSVKIIRIPDGIKKLDFGVFRDCESLEEIHISGKVTDIEMLAFEGCSKLTIHAPESSFAASYAKRNAIPFVAEGIAKMESANETAELINQREFVVENGVLTKYLGDGGDVVIPNGVVSIAPMAFFNCLSLKNVNIPEGVTSLSFFLCVNLSRVTIPSSVADVSFFGCSSLEEITLPMGVNQIGENAFYDCKNLKIIVIPGSVAEIGDGAFRNCSGLQTIIFNEGVEKLGKDLFFCCNSLKDVYLPASLKKIGLKNYFIGMTIHAPVKSYAEEYAKRKKIAFVAWEKE